MIRNRIRVLIIEDSILYQAFLRQVIESDDCLTVVGAADSVGQALELIETLHPDIITLDLQLPDEDGFDLLEEIVRRWDLPVVVVSGNADACERAIQRGARDFIEKIQDASPKTAEQFRLLLKLKLKMQAETRSPETYREAPAETDTSARAQRDSTQVQRTQTQVQRTQTKVQRTQTKVQRAQAQEQRASAQAQRDLAQEPAATPSRRGAPAEDLEERIIVIGASLGGTETTLQILQRLPSDLPGIVIVQHMPPDYTNAYALRLDRYCGLAVREAKNGDRVLPGTALVAKGGEQLTICHPDRGFRVKMGGTERFGGFCPSVDVLSESVAKAAGPAALGVILTGMGKDGAEGLKRMHDSGAYTLGQDEDSCAVFGMPGAAWNLGGVDKLLPPDMIADEIRRYYSRYQRNEAEHR